MNGVSKAQIRPGESAVVYGAGTMGLLWLSLLKRSGAGTLISIEPREARAQAALKVGADHVINPNQKNPVEEVFRLTNGRGADVAAELIGRPETVELAIKSAAYGGRVVIMGVCRPDVKASFNPFEIMRFERKIFGSYIAEWKRQPRDRRTGEGFHKIGGLHHPQSSAERDKPAVYLNRRGESVKTLILPEAS